MDLKEKNVRVSASMSLPLITSNYDSKRWFVIITLQKTVEYFDIKLLNPTGLNISSNKD